MAKAKEEERKRHLTHELRVNKRAPVWVYLKTKTREIIRRRRRHWRAPSSKVGKRSKRKMRDSRGKRKKGKK